MTNRQVRVPRDKHEDDPFVPLVPSHLRAAIAERHESPSALASRMGKGENRQTVHHLMQGDAPIRCRRSRRRKLAKLLDVPETWLAGEKLAFPLPGIAHLQIAERRSPRVMLAVARLMKRVVEATERDLARVTTEPRDPDDFTSARYEVLSFIAWSIGQLANPSEWRVRLIRPKEETRELSAAERRWIDTGVPPGLDAIEPMSEAEEGASLHLTRAFEFILEPWLEGTASLNYGVLEEFLYAVMRGARALIPNSKRPRTLVGSEGQRISPDDPWTPFAVIKWPDANTTTTARRRKDS